jgi:hypothetical protein
MFLIGMGFGPSKRTRFQKALAKQWESHLYALKTDWHGDFPTALADTQNVWCVCLSFGEGRVKPCLINIVATLEGDIPRATRTAAPTPTTPRTA